MLIMTNVERGRFAESGGNVRLCIPTESDAGLTAVVSGHLGRAPFLTLIDTESGELEVVASAPHRDGGCSPLEPLAGRGLSALVCRGVGARAVAAFEAAGIPVLRTEALRVDEALADVGRGGPIAVGPDQVCPGHDDAAALEAAPCRKSVRRL
jgi:predicted Fe-Mo cluster-binding NifX family protein